MDRTQAPAPHVVGVLLAAGAGRRYGMPKVLAHDGDWLRIAVRALLDGGCRRVIVVLGAAEATMPDGASAVIAENWREGASASLKAGLAAAAEDPLAEFAALHLVDTPDIGGDVVARIIAAATETGLDQAGLAQTGLAQTGLARAGLARACFDGRPGHPVVIARSRWAAVAESAAGDEGARAYLQAHRDEVRQVECGDLATGRDQDSPAEPRD